MLGDRFFPTPGPTAYYWKRFFEILDKAMATPPARKVTLGAMLAVRKGQSFSGSGQRSQKLEARFGVRFL